jgi:uracil-DNA glycosylase family 4
MHEKLDLTSHCTFTNFVQLIEKSGPLLPWPFIFPSQVTTIFNKPGPDFFQLAKVMANSEEKLIIDAYLDFLHFRALYDSNFMLPVMFNGNILEARTVPGSGWMTDCRVGPFRKYKYMVVGKAPTDEDIFKGKITFGSNASLLWDMLSVHGFNKSDFYLTCVVKHKTLDPSSNGLKSAWVNNCAAILKLEMMLAKPDFILLTGDEALKAVAGRDKKLSDAVGKVFDVPIACLDGSVHIAKAVAAVNPAYVMRYPEHSDRLRSSVSHFAALCKGEEFLSNETDIQHFDIRSGSELEIIKNEILKESTPVIAIDLEWHGDWPTEKDAYVRTLQLSWKPKFACSIVINKAGGGLVFDSPSPNGMETLRKILNSIFFPEDGRKVRVVGHYLTADLPWLKSLGVDLSALFTAPDDDDFKNVKTNADMAAYRFGFEKTEYEGGFDTLLAAHAVNETDIFNLEEQAVRYCGVPRWEGPLVEWRKRYCKEKGIKDSALGGYGDCPDEVLIPYGCYDADVTRRLFDYYNGTPSEEGKLNKDKYGNNCRIPFWTSMRAYPAFIEMRQKGILIDQARVRELTELYEALYESLLTKLRVMIKWPEFNASSTFHKRELLFGEKLSGKRDADGNPVRQRPNEAVCLNIQPYKSTGTGSKGKLWAELVARGTEHLYTAATDKESLTILSEGNPVVTALRDVRALHYLKTTVLRSPECDKDGIELVDDDGEQVYEKGLLSYINSDNRVRSMFSQAKETGRASSSRPNMQNLGKTIEDRYKAIFSAHGADLSLEYSYPLRSAISARPGTVLVEADYTGAELAIMAWQSGDKNMIDHVRRANLPENDPEYYDIHSNVAVSTFKLSCPPTKKGLKDAGKGGLRTAAKAVVFGYAYGQGAESTARKAKQEGVEITVGEAQDLINGLVAMYPALPIYFQECKLRVKTPGWVCNAFGRFRRFAPSNDRAVIAEYERQSMNFPIQSCVADAVSRSLDYIYHYRENAPKGMTYDIILQVHDAVILEVPYGCVPWVVDEVLPTCMSKNVSIYSCKLDGTRRPGGSGPYNLGIATEVFTKWSIPLTKEDCKVMGIPDRFAQH